MPPPPPPAVYGIWGAGVLEARIESNLITSTNLSRRPPTIEDRAVWMMGLIDYALIYETAAQDIEASIGFAIQIADNKFEGSGNSALVELAQMKVFEGGSDQLRAGLYVRFARVIFTGNYCLHATSSANAFPPINQTMATVRLCGRAASVANNHVRSIEVDPSSSTEMTLSGYHSFDFHTMPGPFIGNVISGSAINHPNAPPMEAYNLTM
ncbi:MAG TPA: hypothetical protein VGB91_05475 [Rhizomicrobium sp.]